MSPSLAPSASFELLSVNPPADDHSVVTAAVPAAATTTVCVTGAGGFIASWLVKLLLERGYNVRGTVRDPNDPKNAHLRALEGAADRLTLCKADLLDYQSLRTAIESCDGVFHTACPVGPDDPKMVGPTVKGTKNVLEAAAAAAGVSRVVFTSSIGAVYMAQNHDPNIMLDETSWSDIEYCRNTKNWYCYAKTIAERAAWEVADERGLKLVVVNPVLVVGPLLQPTLNASTAHLMKYLTGSAKTYANAVQVYVDVRDVAAAHVAVYEAPSAEGRYICAESKLHRGELVCILAELFPEYPIPTRCSDEVNPWRKGYEFTTKRLKDLGLKFTPIQQCLYDTVKSLQDKGHLD